MRNGFIFNQLKNLLSNNTLKMTKERFLLFGGFLFLVYTAWQSEGYYHWDEHYQILEFAQYKSGHAVKEGLAWEFRDQIRPGLLPFIAYLFMSTCRALHLVNPFIIAFFIRLLSVLVGFGVVVSLGKYILKETDSNRTHQLFMILCFLIWFSSFLLVRFSSENWGGFAFIGGFIMWHRSRSTNSKQEALLLFFAGILLGLAFQFRYQMAFAILGFLLWILYFTIQKIRTLGLISLGLIVGLAIGLLADHWLYGNWQLTFYYYFTKNLVQGKAATFGVSPWWYYFTELTRVLGPGINIVLIGSALFGLYLKRNHPLTWATIPFIIGHSIIAHKELRFMFPLLFPFIFFITFGIAAFIKMIKFKKLAWAIISPLILINIGLLYIRISAPAHSYVPYFKFMYNQMESKPPRLLYYPPEQYMYGPPFLRMSFYKPFNLKQIVLTEVGQLSRSNNSEPRYLFTSKGLSSDQRQFVDRLIFKNVDWDMSKINYNGWPKKREHHWSIFSLQHH